jgi:hypothetical protein
MVVKRALSALSKIGIIIAIAVAFIFGLGGTIYLSLRSPEVKVPDVKGKDRMTAETALDGAGLHMRVRATRFSPDARPDTIIDQSPQKDQIIKVGQTVAVVLARGAKEGESATPANGDTTAEKKPETDKATPNQNTREPWESENQNENQNKPKSNKNANNRNANNANNANNGNRNANNRNAGNGNANNRNVNTSEPAASPGAVNSNANKRPTPAPTTPPFVPSRPPGTTP